LVAFVGFASLSLAIAGAWQLAASARGGSLPFPTRVSLPLMKLLAVVVVTNFGFALLQRFQARNLNSSILRHLANRLLVDVGLTTVAIAGLAGFWWGLVWADAFLGMGLALLAMWSCWEMLNWQLPFLVQQTAIAPEVIVQIARQVGGVTHCYNIHSRGVVGRFLWVEMNLIVHPDFTGVIGIIIEQIESGIRERYGPVQAFFIIDDPVLELPEDPLRLNGDPANTN